jgi:hypothetical protein
VKNTTRPSEKYTQQTFQEVENWIKEIGINFNNSRFGSAKKVWDHWHQTLEVPSHEELWSLCEFADLIELYHYFSKEKLDPAIVKRVISGCDLLADESDTTARNYQFEWKVSSRLKRAGFTIVENLNHDVVVEFEGYKLYIECKRVKNYKKMNERIKYAYEKQLASVNNRSQHGAIFLDLSRIVYLNFINSTKQPHTDMKKLNEWRNSFDSELKAMLEKHHSNILNDVKIFVIYYTFPVFIKDDGIYKLIKFNHFLNLTHDDEPQTKKILELIRNSVGNA